MRKSTTNMRIITLILLLFISHTKVNAQFDENYRKQPARDYDSSKFDAGFGFGLDYGGVLGVKVSYLPTTWLGYSELLASLFMRPVILLAFSLNYQRRKE